MKLIRRGTLFIQVVPRCVMKHETDRYVPECDTCQKVKADYMKPGGLLQPLSIPDWSGMTLVWTSL
jgi:hypothetical protein